MPHEDPVSTPMWLARVLGYLLGVRNPDVQYLDGRVSFENVEQAPGHHKPVPLLNNAPEFGYPSAENYMTVPRTWVPPIPPMKGDAIRPLWPNARGF